eukprot:gnl/TRDRNA2_/TRDRNA2_146493_c1_seq1.p1 gnl/TRDRNA2_/TRDRNA2_146493_c1~~gnl/TRDRNA2_/TRDRNA2_146493_c1_seq1.p1  ORF type:complete len:757 (+),score=170.16 gnl/TRDRNA2_/TRDRNA2_146493_c1_seq1:182-2272(+)
MAKDLVQGSRSQTVMFLAALYVMPFALLHVSDMVRVHLDLGGISTSFLQRSLFRKYMCYSEESRRKVSDSVVSLCLLKDVVEVCEGGYMKILQVIRMAGKFFLIIIFVFLQESLSTVLVLVFPAVGFGVAYSQSERIIDLGESVGKEEESVAEHVEKTSQCHDLLCDYHKRPMMNARYVEKISELCQRKVKNNFIRLNIGYVFPWMATLLAVLYLMMGWQQVLAGQKVGRFLAMIQIFFELGGEFQRLFAEIIELLAAIGPLETLEELMNMPTDLPEQQHTSGMTQKEMVARLDSHSREVARSNQGDLADVADTMAIAITDVRYKADNSENEVVRVDSVEISQGSMVAVIGGHASGKASLLKLMTQKIHPQTGHMFVPSHLRYLNVSELPLILEESLWINLTLGNEEVDLQSVRSILDRLGAHRLITTLDDEFRLDRTKMGGTSGIVGWWDKVSLADLQLAHLARGLVANPEVLVIHHPCQHFEKELGSLVMDILSEFVGQRGLVHEIPGNSKLQVRPRTCIYSSRFPEHARNWADLLLEINGCHVTATQNHPSSGALRSRTRSVVQRPKDAANAAPSRQPSAAEKPKEVSTDPETRRAQQLIMQQQLLQQQQKLQQQRVQQAEAQQQEQQRQQKQQQLLLQQQTFLQQQQMHQEQQQQRAEERKEVVDLENLTLPGEEEGRRGNICSPRFERICM